MPTVESILALASDYLGPSLEVTERTPDGKPLVGREVADYGWVRVWNRAALRGPRRPSFVIFYSQRYLLDARGSHLEDHYAETITRNDGARVKVFKPITLLPDALFELLTEEEAMRIPASEHYA